MPVTKARDTVHPLSNVTPETAVLLHIFTWNHLKLFTFPQDDNFLADSAF